MEKLKKQLAQFKDATVSRKDLIKSWYDQANHQTTQSLGRFVAHLMGWEHDYDSIVNAAVAAALASVHAVSSDEEQGGLTGFQMRFIASQVLMKLSYTSNKTGLRIIDYDKALYPQYSNEFEGQILPRSVWARLKAEANNRLAKAWEEHEVFLKQEQQYLREFKKFVEKYPDYFERPEHYEQISFGTPAEWTEMWARKEAGFEFAPIKPFDLFPSEEVVEHWERIIAGEIPFNMKFGEEE